jgi:hypothetical protein
MFRFSAGSHWKKQGFTELWTFSVVLLWTELFFGILRNGLSPKPSQSRSYFTTVGLPPISSSWWQAPWDSRPPIFSTEHLRRSPYVTSSLMRGWVCRLQLLLVLASAVIPGPSPAGLMTLLYCLKFETPLTWKIRSPYLYPLGTRWPNYTPGTRFPFRCLLLLAGLRWRYSNRTPHGVELH